VGVASSYLLDSDSVTADDLLDGKVTEDDVLDTLDGDSEVLQDDLAVLSNDGLVAADLDVVARALDGASDEDNGSVVTLDGSGQLAEGRHLNGLSTLTTSGSAIGGSVANSGNILKGSSTLNDVTLDIDHARCGRCQSGDGCEAEGDKCAELHCVEVLTSSRRNDCFLKRRTEVWGLEKNGRAGLNNGSAVAFHLLYRDCRMLCESESRLVM
jgi:hypothetical protein